MGRNKRSKEESLFLEEVSGRFRDAYRRSDLTSHEDIAEEMDSLGFGIYPGSISKILRGSVMPSTFVFAGLCRALRVSPEWVLTGHDPSKDRDEQILAMVRRMATAEKEESRGSERSRKFTALFESLSEEKQSAVIDIIEKTKQVWEPDAEE